MPHNSQAAQEEGNVLIVQSDSMQKVAERVKKASLSEANVLITGESGTGKEVVARQIHQMSCRFKAPFVAVNCGAISPELLESELFGHVRGSFTGAHCDREGRFAKAKGGTLFFDEIGDMSPALQVKLLRVLQERVFEPVGSSKSVPTDVRVLAATHIDLPKAIEQKKFRIDLYYRLNVIPIHVPPLRTRPQDTLRLFEFFLKKYSPNPSKINPLSGLSLGAKDFFKNYSWPGNVRELENCVQRLVVLKDSTLVTEQDLKDLGLHHKAADAKEVQGTDTLESSSLGRRVLSYENRLILKALECCGWNYSKAAEFLKVNRTTLMEKVKRRSLRKLKQS